MEFLLSFLPSLRHIGAFGYLVALALSTLESLPFVGLAFPGTVLIFLFGFFSSQGYLHFNALIGYVMIGAMLGDGIGYWLGLRGKELFKEGNRILRPSHLKKGEAFFHSHGEKSIFLGRFVGPLRPIIPFVAGLSGMGTTRFLVWDALAAFLWSWSHLTIGYFFGGAAAIIETWFTRASAFLLILAAIFVLLWFVAKRLRPFARMTKSVFRSMGRAVMENPEVHGFLDRHPIFARFMRRRFDRKRFSGLPLTLFSIAAIYLIFLLSGVVEGVVTAEPIVSVDARVANLMFAFRDAGFVRGFLWITLLARRDVVILFAIVVVILSVLWNRRSYVMPFLVTLAGSQLFASLGKRLVHRPRPSIAYYVEPSFSFPSGHATLSVALYGFIAYMLLRNVKRKRRYQTIILFLTLAIVFLVGLSRIYLGVHFLSDVWSGYLLGALWLIIGISIHESGNRKRKDTNVPVRMEWGRLRSVTAAMLAIPVLWYGYQGLRYDPPRAMVDRTMETEVTDDVVGSFDRLGLPKYSETFSGTHQEPMSFFIVAKDDAAFVETMERSGWMRSDPVTVANMTTLAGASVMKTSYPRAPMTPSFWNTRVHDFGFQKQTSMKNVHARHHARFWKTPIRTEDGDTVYVGTASLDVGIKWIVTHRISPDIDTERETLLGDLVATGSVVSSEKFRFVDPVLGKNFTGDPFFTDGETYVLRFE
ncbi:MAG: phosphatase PAP2 family protein [Candidatus Moranbacteria bacterium]|nr:phosphatase PAP2 family protein [Candidatus Moranbacteria bacterium]